MKQKFITLAVAVLAATSIYAQAPNTFSYQAVVRDASDDLVTNSTVGMQISILQYSDTGAVAYAETHAPMTNANGLVSLQVGGGSVVSGSFASINWGNGPYFIKTETDPAGGASYSITGTQQLLSVPYALHAGNLPNGVDLDNVMAWDTTGTDHWVAQSLSTSNTGQGIAANNMQPYQVLNWCIALYGTYPIPNGADPFIAELMLFAGNYAPQGWVKCDGQLLPISQNSAMFSLMGTMYGGDGETTFGMPDLRGRVPIHHGNGPGLPSYSQGQKGGLHSTTLVGTNIPSHNHGVVFTDPVP